MSEQWLGFVVSISCGNSLGTFQGQVTSVNENEQTITLDKTFRNGVPCAQGQVKIRACDILNLKLLDKILESPPPTPSTSTVTVTRETKKRVTRTVSESLVHNKVSPAQRESPRQFQDENRARANSVCESSWTPNRRDRLKQRLNERDEVCFGTPIQHFLHQEFDFEKNLALFDKQAFCDEMLASQKPDVVRQTDIHRRQPQTYRHDENILSSSPAVQRQIVVPTHCGIQYVTDAGLVVPSVTSEMRSQLFAVAERLGFSRERQVELMGRAATELSLQLLGGEHRLNPHNTHQFPTVVALCGPHHQGALAVSCVRHLAGHGVRTVVLLAEPTLATPTLSAEVSLYRLTNQTLTGTVEDLPNSAVDLIVVALEDHQMTARWQNQSWYVAAVEWANKHRAPVLALDPPPEKTKINTKLSVVPVLPLSYGIQNGKIYLCNLGFPAQVFREVGIKYSPPFGTKFVIPLHPDNS